MTRRILAAALLTGTMGCNNMMDYGTMATSVSAVAPLPNAAAVPRADTIRMWFDMPMGSASCAARFTLHLGDSSGPTVAGRMMFGDNYRLMMFVPNSPMQPGSQFFAHMRDGMTMPTSMYPNGRGWMMGGGGTMTIGQMPPGTVRMPDGMGWAFTTEP